MRIIEKKEVFMSKCKMSTYLRRFPDEEPSLLYLLSYGDQMFEIPVQTGTVLECGHNGAQIEDLLMVCLIRLKSFQAQAFPCRENAIAITKLEEALMWLDKRTADRVERGVEGKEEA